MPRSSPYLLYGIPAFGASGVLAYIMWRSTTEVDELGAWVIAVNIVAFLTYLYDKSISRSDVTRVPELILHLLVLFGGGLGAGAGIVLGRHKTRHLDFLVWYGLCVIGSLLLRDAYYQSIQPLLGSLGW